MWKTTAYILKSAWREASVLVRTIYVVILVALGPVGAYIQDLPYDWATQLALWHWLVVATVITILTLLWLIGKRGMRFEDHLKQGRADRAHSLLDPRGNGRCRVARMVEKVLEIPADLLVLSRRHLEFEARLRCLRSESVNI